MSAPGRLAASFRDPSGYVFREEGVLLRWVAESYRQDYEALMDSGLHDALVADGLLIPIEERRERAGAVTILRPEVVPTISYPYEWCFGQLRDAAILTLELARRALERGLALKDASAYNVQFLRGRPIHIDTLSFERYEEGEPWVAYRQFCGHFLAPLALMAHVDARLGRLLRVHLDGVPLDLASRLLPFRTRFAPGLLAHIHLHGRASKRRATEQVTKVNISKIGLLALLDNLRTTVEGLRPRTERTLWGDYYANTNYSESAFEAKRELVEAMLAGTRGICWDLGANTGEFSRIAAGLGLQTVAWDMDPGAVEEAYRLQGGVLPLVQDLTNPSPDLGWAGEERDGLASRGPADVVMALALVHHLAIGNNVPLSGIAAYLARLGKILIVEFVPKEDSQVRRLLADRRDVFPDYDQAGFEAAFAPFFTLEAREPLPGTVRTLYRMARR